jgi:2'-5' RNA ligase
MLRPILSHSATRDTETIREDDFIHLTLRIFFDYKQDQAAYRSNILALTRDNTHPICCFVSRVSQ